MNVPFYQRIARALQARINCEDSNNEWYQKHTDTIENLTDQVMPHGSGFDGKSWLDFDASIPERLIFFIEYHHMDEHGYYDGWSTLKITVRPSLAWGYTMSLTGIVRRYRHDADYFRDVLYEALDRRDYTEE